MQLINYCNLFEGRRFTVKGDPFVYIKIANSHAVKEETEEDAIFSLHERCHPCGNNKKLLHQVIAKEETLWGSHDSTL